jgi:hypothetical protein
MNPYSPPAPSAASYADAPPYAPSQGGAVSEAAIEELRQTRPWVIFMAVMTFLGAAFTLLGALGMFAMGAIIPAGLGAAGGAGANAAMGPMMGAIYGGTGFLYLCLSGAYVYPAIKLWSFGSAIGRLLASRSASDLEDALKQQKSYWKFWAIAVIALMGLGALLFIGMMIAVAAGVSKAASFTP